MKVRVVINGTDRYDQKGFGTSDEVQVFITEGIVGHEEVYSVLLYRKWKKRRVKISRVINKLDTYILTHREGAVEIAMD